MFYIIYDWVTKIILIPLVFIIGGIEATRVFLDPKRRQQLEKENKIP